MSDVTELLERIDTGDPQAADKLLPLVYDDLRRFAAQRLASERGNHTLQATALVHEAFLRLVGSNHEQAWEGRTHFFAAAAEAMRRILVDSARAKKAQKRGGDRDRVELEDLPSPASDGVDLLGVHEALSEFEQLDPRRATLVKLRYFAGFTIQEAADALGVSRATAANDWTFASCWLKRWLLKAELETVPGD